MAKQKGPFKDFTVAEVNQAERNSFNIVIGNDFYAKDGEFIFTQSQAEKYYGVLLENILYTIDNGNPKQKSAAMKCLVRLHIQPFRLH
jgi:hypothetical protein